MVLINVNKGGKGGNSFVHSHDCECSSYSVWMMTNNNTDFKKSCERATINFFLQLQTTFFTLGKSSISPKCILPTTILTALKRCITSKEKWKAAGFTRRTHHNKMQSFGFHLVCCPINTFVSDRLDVRI